MPTKKKRIMVTIPQYEYDALQEFRDVNGFCSDAAACLCLICHGLRELEYLKPPKNMQKKS